ncbi:unnamed protein product [Phytophthora fragariaefolia]|uniref:Unnamed protein product n=1 Tax=Phytophthora fragariaefolia TaxID=1490495 RepID=A0A9W6UCG9_9STRA|nr:unnamed protein product [Phytophthora fragariaefolia]
MRVLTAALVGNPLPEHIKMTVFMDDLRVGPVHTQLFRVHANTMEEAIQMALQEEYSHRQAHTPATAWQGNPAPGSAQVDSPGNGATSGPVPMELGLAQQRDIRCFGCGRLGHMKRVCPARGQQKPSFGKSSGSKGRVEQPRPKRQGNVGHHLGTLESRKSSDRLLVVHGCVRGYAYPFRILIDSGASKKFARRLSLGRNADKFADRLRENSGAEPVSVRLANGSLVEVPRILVNLSVKFEGFDSTERFIVLERDEYDLILGMPWLEKHEPWIDWRGKAIGASRTALSDRTLVKHVPTSVKSKGVRHDRQGASASEGLMGVAEVFGVPQEVTVDSVKESAEAPPGVKPSKPREASRSGWASCPACGATKPRQQRKSGLRSQTEVAQGESEPKTKAPQTWSSDGHYHVFDSEAGLRVKADAVQLEALPEVAELLNLEEMSLADFLADLKAAEMVLLRPEPTPEELNPSSVMEEDVLEEFRKQRASRLGSEILKNPKDPVQWHLPREQCEVIDAIFAAKAKADMVRESKSPHSSPTFCVRKPNGKWRLVHAYNKLSSATVLAQTPIPRKDVLLNNMAGCTLFSALDLVDGYYQILVRESDIPLTAVSTPSGMIWAPLRAFAQTYFDDIFVHSRAKNGQMAMEVPLGHLRRVFEVMRANKLYANIDKCVFGAEEINVLGCFVNSAGVRADAEKVKTIAAWSTPRSQKDLRKWLGLTNYLHKYSAGYAGLAKTLSDLLKKDTGWRWECQHQEAFDSIKASVVEQESRKSMTCSGLPTAAQTAD